MRKLVLVITVLSVFQLNAFGAECSKDEASSKLKQSADAYVSIALCDGASVRSYHSTVVEEGDTLTAVASFEEVCPTGEVHPRVVVSKLGKNDCELKNQTFYILK
jgi:hypothetical protein